MFALNPLAAALQGIGYGSLLTALQGLWAVTTIPALLPIEAAGGHAVLQPRRRVRRTWLTPYQAITEPPPAAAPVDDEEARDELELLRCIGAL